MKKIRVLLVDDAAVIRKVLGTLIASDSQSDAAGTGANGKVALELLQPDMVTMHTEMSEMNGLRTVRKILKRGSQVPLIMCSALTATGAGRALDTLAFGPTLIALHEDSPEISCRPAVDVLFRSIAKVYGADSLGVVLTGMGQDGLNGSQHITKVGDTVIAQEREGGAVWGISGMVVDAGLASAVLSRKEIASEIVRRGVSTRDAASTSEGRI